MKLTIEHDGHEIVLSNNGLDNLNFVKILCSSEGAEMEVIIPIDELFHSLEAFRRMRDDLTPNQKL